MESSPGWRLHGKELFTHGTERTKRRALYVGHAQFTGVLYWICGHTSINICMIAYGSVQFETLHSQSATVCRGCIFISVNLNRTWPLTPSCLSLSLFVPSLSLSLSLFFPSLSPAESIARADGEPKCCLFSFTQKFQASRVLRAQLWVNLRAADEATTVFLQISRLMPVTDGRSRHVRIRSLKLEVSAGVSSWQSIDVKQVLTVWLRQPETNWGIEINAFDLRGNDLAVTSTESGEEGLVRGAATPP